MLRYTPYMKRLSICAVTVVVFFMPILNLSADMYGYLNSEDYWSFHNLDYGMRRYHGIIKEIADTFEVETSLIMAIIKAESDFNHLAISKKGAKGLMQIMPDTASIIDLEEPFSPKENITAGTRYVGLLLERFNNDKMLALAAYNAGPEAVEAYHGIPPFHETRDFILRVLSYYKKYHYMD